MPKQQDVHDILEKIIEDPTIDKLMQKHPARMAWPEDYLAMVQAQRRMRAMFIQHDSEKKSKRRA